MRRASNRLAVTGIFVTIVVSIFGAGVAPVVAAEKLTIGIIPYVSAGPNYIAVAKKYYEAEGLDVVLKPFDSAQTIAVAVASGDLDIGTTSLTAGVYNLAGKGALKVIGGILAEKKGYRGNIFVVSKRAYDDGIRSIKDLKGRSFGLNQRGSSFHYSMARSLEAVGLGADAVEIRILQTVENTVSALRTGQVDAGVLAPVLAEPLLAAGEIKEIGVVSDYLEYQFAGIFANSALIAKRPEVAKAFVRGYVRGLKDYAEAYLSKNAKGDIVPSATTDEVSRLISKAIYGDETKAATVTKASVYITEGAKINLADIKSQIVWYQANGFVDAAVDSTGFVDESFATPLQK